MVDILLSQGVDDLIAAICSPNVLLLSPLIEVLDILVWLMEEEAI